MNNKWDKRFLELAKLVSTWSKDPSTQVGAVITNEKVVVSVGFNGYPMGLADDDLHDRVVKYEKIIHAEKNAILFAQRNLSNHTIYVYPMAPCPQCASAIIQSGIKRVVTIPETEDALSRWEDKINLTKIMFRKALVGLIYLKD